MSWLTESELSQAREAILAVLPDVVTIQRRTVTTDSAGYSVDSWATAATVVGRLDNVGLRSDKQEFAMRPVGVAVYQLTLEWGADVRDGDRVVVNGKTYELKQVQIAQTYPIVRRAVAIEVGNGNV